MFHIFWTNVKLNLKNRILVFWTLLFPAVLATFFHFGLYNMDDDKVFEVLPVAISEEGMDEDFLSYMENLDGEMITIKTCQKAERDLKDGKICGIFYAQNDDVHLKTAKQGIAEDMLMRLLDTYKKTRTVTEKIVSDGRIPALPEKQTGDLIAREDLEGQSASACTPYYFSILAMSCLYSQNAFRFEEIAFNE